MNVSGLVRTQRLYPQQKILQSWRLNMKLGGPQEVSDIFGEEKYLLPMSGIET
jgi:hypothetical protein